MSKRIKKVFSKNNKKLITFVTGGDPDYDTSLEIINSIIQAGADIIEIGMPFSDPMADGPTIQLSSNRAIDAGTNLDKIFSICKDVRKENLDIPIILMGYYNVIHHYGIKKFTKECSLSQVDGLIVVDLQPEEDPELTESIKNFDIDLIRLITPTTNNERLKIISSNASGFLYYVTIAGVTGQNSAKITDLKDAINNVRAHSNLPVVAGFGINSKDQVKEICKITDGVVVGSSLVKIIEKQSKQKNKMINSIKEFIKDLKEGTKL